MKVQKSTGFICRATNSFNVKCNATFYERFIQGGAPDNGDGSKEQPWNSFSQAESGSWVKLIVLPSPVIIYGGITLQDGQKIEGENSDLALFASQNNNVNDGDVITCNGDNSIRCIKIQEAYRSGINSLNSRNLVVEDCVFFNTNTAFIFYSTDIADFSTLPATSFTAFAAIETFGGTFVNGVIQSNITNGSTTITGCTFNNLATAISICTGNSQIFLVENTNQYHRSYKIKNCNFTAIGVDVISFVTCSNGRLDGVIENCQVVNNSGLQNHCIHYDQNRANNTHYPLRGNSQAGVNIVKDCYFNNNAVYGVNITIRNNETGNDAKLIVECNKFIDCGYNDVEFAMIEQGYAQIQAEIEPTCSGNDFHWIVHDNTIIDSSGLTPSISAFYAGGTTKLVANIFKNSVIGTTTGLDILNYSNPSPHAGNGEFTLTNNTFKDNDSVIVLLTNEPYTNLTLKVENNCFINTGARNSPPFSNINASYYGGAVIYGGATNPAAISIGQNGSNLGNTIMDLGNGPLHSKGNNAFTGTVGPNFWVETGLTLDAQHNYFSPPASSAGAGGTVNFSNPLTFVPPNCRW